MTSPHHPDPPTSDEPDFDPGAVDESADDALLALLGEALAAADPVPDHVVAAARVAVAWRTIDQDLAGLVFDSSVDLAGVRDRDAARQLTFRSDDVEIELMLADSAPRRLVGQLVPAIATTVRLESTDAQREEITDRFGRFRFDGVPTGPVRITVPATARGRAIATDWMLL